MTQFVSFARVVCDRMTTALRRADRAPGRCRAGGGLLGGKDLAGRFLIRDGRTYDPFYFFSFSSNNSAASARKRRSSSFFGWFLSIHCTARSYHSRALSLSPSRQ
jgi:hypothetical protein